MNLFSKIAFIYAMFGLASGVFYREFTKFQGFNGETSLAYAHVHLFAMGVLFFLIVGILTLLTDIKEKRSFRRFMVIYNIGLPLTVFLFYVRGIAQVLETNLSRAMDLSISGIAGIGHILMAVGLVFFFMALMKANPQIQKVSRT